MMKTHKKTAIVNALTTLFIGILVVFAARMPFVHKKYEYINSKASKEYKEHYAKYKPIITERDLALENIVNELEAGNIDNITFANSFRKIKENSNLELKEFTRIKNEYLAKYKYRGWNAYYIFLLQIGTPIMAFILCLLFFYILINPITTKLKKIIFSLYGSLFLFSTSYMILHSLFAEQVYHGDFPKSWYRNIMLYVPVIISLTLPLLFYHYQTIEQKLKSIISNLIVFIIKSDKYIENKDTKTKHLEDYLTEFEKILE